jgi:hypothetical protein
MATKKSSRSTSRRSKKPVKSKERKEFVRGRASRGSGTKAQEFSTRSRRGGDSRRGFASADSLERRRVLTGKGRDSSRSSARTGKSTIAAARITKADRNRVVQPISRTKSSRRAEVLSADRGTSTRVGTGRDSSTANAHKIYENLNTKPRRQRLPRFARTGQGLRTGKIRHTGAQGVRSH